MKDYYLHEGGKLYYSDTGRGEVVVLLHGYLETSDIWNGFAESLAREYRVIAVDMPGHGQSSVHGDCHTMEFMATALKALLDHLETGKVFLTGHSMGGYVTLAFLELFPEMLGGYCLFHSHPLADSPLVVEKRIKEAGIVRSGMKHLIYPVNIPNLYAADNLEKFHEAVQFSKDIAATISDEGIIAVLNGMRIRPSRVHVMEEGKVPSLWILGRKDNIINCAGILEEVKLPPNARVIVLEESGHMGFIEEQELAIRVVADFLKGLNTTIP